MKIEVARADELGEGIGHRIAGFSRKGSPRISRSFP